MALMFTGRANAKRADLDTYHTFGCTVCPLRKLKNKHPQMEPTGAEHPLIYVLGEAPGKKEDDEDEQFVGPSGEMLRCRIPKRFRSVIRYNNVVRTRPHSEFKNETPPPEAIEACRASIVADIEQSKPRAIFGFGNIPLAWVAPGMTGITLWRGRRMPVKIGSHTCWYYPMLHPSFLLRNRRDRDRDAPPDEIKSEDERMFAFDLERAFAEVENLSDPKVHTIQEALANIECITDPGEEGIERIQEMLDWAHTRPDLGIDYETDRLRPYFGGEELLLSIAVDDGKHGFAFPVDHPEAPWTDNEKARILSMWRTFLRTYRGRKFVHNLAFEMEWTGEILGTDLLRQGRWEDTATQAAILDERVGKQKPGCFALEFLVQQHFGFNLKKGSNMDRAQLKFMPVESVLRYNGGDARYHLLLGLVQEKLINKEVLQAPYELGLRRVPTAVLSQIKGVPLDQEERSRLQEKYEERVNGLIDEIMRLPDVIKFKKARGHVYQPLAPQDTLYLFKDMLKRDECIVINKYNQKETFSVDESVLQQIDHPLSNLTIRLRKAAKQKSTYIDPLRPGHPDSVVFPDGMLHTVFNTFFAETGRLSSDSPNLQNFPKRDGELKEVRRQIIALRAKGKRYKILSFDYGQIEARVIAMFSLDKNFIKALWENYDVHMEWAERIARAFPDRIGGRKNLEGFKLIHDPVFKKDPRVIACKTFRTDIKNQWTFPLFFGARLESAAEYLWIPENVLRPLYDDFWEEFSSVKDWQDRTIKFYRNNGYVECLTGRRRRGPMSLNQIINSPVQGTAAEIVLDGMCRLSEKGIWELQPEINIHDDLTYLSIEEDRVEDVAEQIIDEMIHVPFEWAKVVPITVEMSWGDNWMELEEVATFSSDTW